MQSAMMSIHRTSCGVVLAELFEHPLELLERNLPAVGDLDVRVLQHTHTEKEEQLPQRMSINAVMLFRV